VTINDGDTGITVTETQPINAALLAELTWAKLFAGVMCKDLGVISTTIKRQTTSAASEMKKSAEKLHDQLNTANRTVGELSDHAGIRSVSVKK
jgi:hypothetical protein